MGHRLRLFAGERAVLAHYVPLLPSMEFYRLTPGASHIVLPLEDAILDKFRGRYGSGVTLSEYCSLTSCDADFALEASRDGALVYLETDYFGGIGYQAAAFWRGGIQVIEPHFHFARVEAARPPRSGSLIWQVLRHGVSRLLGKDPLVGQKQPPAREDWPINRALLAMGVSPTDSEDAFDVFGLGLYRSHAVIRAKAEKAAVELPVDSS